jgi:hypothetical protein
MTTIAQQKTGICHAARARSRGDFCRTAKTAMEARASASRAPPCIGAAAAQRGGVVPGRRGKLPKMPAIPIAGILLNIFRISPNS